MDVQKQIEYWVQGAEEDFAAAQSLFDKGHFRHCLFFVHLAIEKILKAHIVKQTNSVPPKIHNLFRLSSKADLKLDEKQQEFLRRFDIYQLEGRYPDSQQIPVNLKIAKQEMAKAKEILKWLKIRL